jgi:Protein of unknown function (DUF1566)
MKRAAKRVAVIASLVVSTICTTASAQTVANGPYYATPSWDQTLPANTRFIVLANMGSQAVLDRETGVVWDRTPSDFSPTWGIASLNCVQQSTGTRFGWRLPTLQEILSLFEPVLMQTPSGPTIVATLPAGHPFTGVANTEYWTATPANNNVFGQPQQWVARVGLFFGTAGPRSTESTARFWCVRSPQSVDRQ